MNCKLKSTEMRLKALAEAIWRGSIRKVTKAGICRICGSALPHAYRIGASDGTLRNISTDDAAQCERAAKLLEDPKSGIFVFPLSLCECMCDDQLYRDAIAETKRWRSEWLKSQTEKTKAFTVPPLGGDWDES